MSRLLGGVLALALALSACDRAARPDGQVIARVNADEISVHQLNFALEKAFGARQSAANRAELLDKMIDRQLAVQAALSHQLDRRPDIVMRLEEARRDILAAAYADEMASNSLPPTDDAVARYFADHPGLFAGRRLYRLREIALASDAPALAETQARLERQQNLADLLAWLRQQPGGFSDQSVLRAAEQLPIEVADRMVKVKPGELISFRMPYGLVIYELQSSEAAGIGREDAAPLIRHHLKKRQEAASFRAELDRLRSSARIERHDAALRDARAP